MSQIYETIMAADDGATKLVRIAGWGVTIEVRSMSTRHQLAIAESVDDDAPQASQMVSSAMIAATCFDPDTGEKVFEDALQVMTLYDKNASNFGRLIDVVNSMVGSKADQVELGNDSSA